MKSVAVICEYNPFHKGHLILLSEIKRRYPDRAVISVMSGNTVQRGEFAVSDKYERARNAVLGGSDLVLELPFPFSVSSGEQFARAGTFIADALGCEGLFFGSETGDIKKLEEYAENLSSPAFEAGLEKELRGKKDVSFISAKETAYEILFGEKLPEGGNDILGIEYIRAIKDKGYTMIPETFARTENYSATEARASLLSGNEAEIKRLIPDFCGNETVNGGFDAFYRYFSAAFTVLPAYDDGSGIFNAVRTAFAQESEPEGFFAALPTKTYTLARLRRAVFSYVFGIGDAERNEEPEYTVLLGASGRGLEYLSEKRKELTLPVLTKAADVAKLSESAREKFRRAETAERFFRLGYGNEKYKPFSVPFFSDLH